TGFSPRPASRVEVRVQPKQSRALRQGGHSRSVVGRGHRMKRNLFVAAAATGLALGFLGCDKSAPAPPSATSPVADTTNSSPPPAKPRPEFQRLIGKWERPDGGYVLEIRSVSADGRLDATYSNPSPIHVSRTLAYREGDATKVFVELTDVNYPGCT